MKGALAAWTAAVSKVLAKGEPPGSLSLLITGDEEGEATDGTVRVIETLKAEGETIDHCLVGEPSSTAALGDMIKIGRRGSINAYIEVTGTQGHVAYPHRAANPVPVLVALLNRLQTRVLDDGFTAFQPSNLEITTVDVGNPTTNLIPAKATARINIRFNPNHTGAELAAWFEAEANRAGECFQGHLPRLSISLFCSRFPNVNIMRSRFTSKDDLACMLRYIRADDRLPANGTIFGYSFKLAA